MYTRMYMLYTYTYTHTHICVYTYTYLSANLTKPVELMSEVSADLCQQFSEVATRPRHVCFYCCSLLDIVSAICLNGFSIYYCNIGFYTLPGDDAIDLETPN